MLTKELQAIFVFSPLYTNRNKKITKRIVNFLKQILFI